jgi:DNA-binding response OmpR family regulator
MSMQHPSKRILVVDDEPDILEFLQVSWKRRAIRS